MRSLSSLNASAASEKPYRFEYIEADGTASGVFFHVLGDQSPTVKAEVNRLLNERRQRDAVAEATRINSGQTTVEANFRPIEDDIDFGHRLAATRLVGWEGIGDDGVETPFTSDGGLTLIKSNDHAAAAIAKAASKLSNFMKA